MAAGYEKVGADHGEALAYLRTNLVHNSLEVWSLMRESHRHDLYVHRDGGIITAHLGIYHSPETDYVSIGGREEAIEALLPLVPAKAVVLLSPEAYEKSRERLGSDKVYANDLLLVRRGEERLVHPELAVRLTERDAEDYSRFGPSFEGPPTPVDWARERLSREAVFGVFDGTLVSVADAIAPLPEMAVIVGVETRKEFRRRGFGTIVVSAALREALARSETCLLGVAQSNEDARRLYGRLGFKKVGEEIWVDIGTGRSP
jgi:ribosomal protein S18 acetylase RimI-like enzyme